MAKKVKTFRLTEETTAILEGVVDKAGKKVSEAKTIEEWAKAYKEGRIALMDAICDDALTQTKPKVLTFISPSGTSIRGLLGLPKQRPVPGSSITDRSNAQPYTVAKQRHEVKE